MPCNADHMNATDLELNLSRVLLLLDELESGKHVNTNHSSQKTALLCKLLHSLEVKPFQQHYNKELKKIVLNKLTAKEKKLLKITG